MTGTRDRNGSLWMLAAAPTIWAAHLLLSYITAAIYCAKAAAPGVALTAPRLAIVAYTIAALLGIAAFGWLGWRRHSEGRASLPHDADTPEDRRRFLGFATFLLSGLSAVAVAMLAMSVAFVGTCR